MDLVVIGLSHQTAPVEVRERLAVAPTEIEGWLQALLQLPGIAEVAIVSTCNRVEIYAAAPNGRDALDAIREHLCGVRMGDGAPLDIGSHLYERWGREAVHHLFRVTASLDSLVVGEPQILGQVKDAFDTAMRAGSAGTLLGAAFPRAFRVARKVRRDTAIARQRVSVSSVAVDVARQVWSGFSGRRVLLVGAGKMADLAARALRADGATVAVTNRTPARAQELAARLGCAVEPFTDLAGALTRADLVITSTGAREPVLAKALVERVQKARKWRPLVLIDIAVPRDVDPTVDDLEGVIRWDIDDLQEEVQRNLAGRRNEADRAEAVVEEELVRFMAALRGRGVGPTITALRARYQSVARLEAEKALAALPGLDDRGRRAVSAMADAIVAKLLHPPQVALKKGAAGDDGDALVAAATVLFDLPPVEPLAALEEDDDEDEPGPSGGDVAGGETPPADRKKKASAP